MGQGIYKGFSTQLSQELTTHVHTWCYGHILNLVMGDITGEVIQTITLFSLLNDLAKFIKSSYKRMKKWERGSTSTKRLQAIGQTRWWAKGKALERVFGSFQQSDECLYVQVLMTLLAIRNDETMESSVRAMASAYLDNLSKYEIILTGHIFMRLFKVTTTLSKYLQTSGLDSLTANRLITQASVDIRNISRDFDTVAADRRS